MGKGRGMDMSDGGVCVIIRGVCGGDGEDWSRPAVRLPGGARDWSMWVSHLGESSARCNSTNFCICATHRLANASSVNLFADDRAR